MFDAIREQKKITTENNGSTELLKLLGKAWELNVPLPGKGKKKPGGPGSGVRPGHVELSEGLHVDADFTDPVTLAAEKEQLALAARTKVRTMQLIKVHFFLFIPCSHTEVLSVPTSFQSSFVLPPLYSYCIMRMYVRMRACAFFAQPTGSRRSLPF